MKKLVSILAAALVAVAVASCTSVWPVAGATGKIGSKVGQASVTRVLWFGATGDASIVAAAKSAGISVIGTIDQKVETGLLSVTYTTIVTGE